jgi:hypothetical protein
MFVKIFKPKASFGGIKYNTRKVDGNKGQLMKVANFGPLQAFGQLKPHDYINYLSALAAQNKNVKLPQFHAVVSAKGKSYDKTSLTGIAEAWLKEMGYGNQPYLIVFHHDTDNNHVHLVSSRVERNGEKISSAFEGVNAQKAMKKVLGYDVAMKYKFSTRAQFFMVLESFGFPGKDPDEKLLQKKMEAFVPDRKRASEIRNIMLQCRSDTGYRNHLKNNLGIELIFHAADGKKPYGYSIIDHQDQQVFKGSEVLPLKELLFTGEMPLNNESFPAEERTASPADYIGPVSIADDVDDQQIHGMRRRRQKKSRTNTR